MNNNIRRMSRQLKLTDYEGFVAKFEPKKTTDDCYTPQPVFEAVLEYVKRFVIPLEGIEIIRPFWPGGDYQAHDYPDGCVVIDNPPFSITSEILKFYSTNRIKFFLFCNGLTAMQSSIRSLAYHLIKNTIVFENGAKIKVSFVTNIRPNKEKIVLAGWLDSRISELNKQSDKSKNVLIYPKEVISPALLFKYICEGINIVIPESACSELKHKDKPFGGGMLLAASVKDELERERERITEVRILSPDAELAKKTLNSRHAFTRKNTPDGFTFE